MEKVDRGQRPPGLTGVGKLHCPGEGEAELRGLGLVLAVLPLWLLAATAGAAWCWWLGQAWLGVLLVGWLLVLLPLWCWLLGAGGYACGLGCWLGACGLGCLVLVALLEHLVDPRVAGWGDLQDVVLGLYCFRLLTFRLLWLLWLLWFWFGF